MKIQTFSIIAGSEACNAHCPFCISKMTPPQGVTLKTPAVNWRNFRIGAQFAKQYGVTTTMITGKGEPTLFPEQITKYLEELRCFNFPFLELQTNGILLAAIYWAVDGPDGVAGTADDFNADAVSMSLGTSQPYTYKGYCDTVLPDLTTAIKYAVDRNVVVVSAAGNSGNAGVSIPGCISYSTTIGAVDKYDKIASFSGRGKALDLVAPGVNLYSAWLSGYKTASGTSMATPVVSGSVALVKAAHPTYTAAQVENALRTTAKDLGKAGYDTSYGWGLVNAAGAVQ